MKYLQQIFTGIILLTILNTSYSQYSQQGVQANWFWQQPYPSGNQLNAVDFADSQTGYAAGNLGTILKTTNGGENWSVLSANTNTLMLGISCFSQTGCVIVGDSGLILRTTDGGLNWDRISAGTNLFFHDVTFLNSLTGYAVGGSGVIIKTTNSGLNWSFQNSGTKAILFCVSFLDSLHGCIGGRESTLRTTNGGENWIYQNMGGSFVGYVSICYLDSQTIYTVNEDNYFYKSSNAGINWSSQELLNLTNDIARSMTFKDINTGYIAMDYGRVLISTDAGNNWSYDSTYKPNYYKIRVFQNISLINLEKIIVVGGGGIIIKSTNEGQSWQAQNGNFKDLTKNLFTDENTGYCTGKDGTILKTTNAGLNWLNQNSGTNYTLNGIYFINNNTGYICGDSGVIRKTTNGGINWTEISIGSANILSSLYFFNSDTGYVIGYPGLIMKTTNGGLNWQTQVSGTTNILNEIDFLNYNTGLICAVNRILRTTNAGDNWSIVASGTDGRGNDIKFLDSTRAISVTGTTGNYISTNAGLNWIRYPNSFGVERNSIYFFDSNTGYGAGGSGTVVRTTNGGFNWTFIGSITDNQIYSIYFTNENTGYIAGDFGTILKTTNGGMTFIESINESIPKSYFLSQNYPNPFNPSTRIRYTIENTDFISLKVYDLLGNEVEELVNERKYPGSYEVEFNGSDFPSGVYFYSLYINNKLTETKKMLLTK